MAYKKVSCDLRRLTKEERKIYRSVMAYFPATAKESAYNIAIEGGIRLQFNPT